MPKGEGHRVLTNERGAWLDWLGARKGVHCEGVSEVSINTNDLNDLNDFILKRVSRGRKKSMVPSS